MKGIDNKFICDYCWATIDKIRDKKLEHHFCNQECYYWYKRSQKKYCKKCNIELIKPYNDYNKRWYCCKSCFEYDFANTNCACCWKPIYVRPDILKKWTKIWFTCSKECSAKIRERYYLWDKNPNYKWNKYTWDWYNSLDVLPTIWNVKINNIIMQIVLWIPKTPKWFQIHHRDCNVNNNSPENLTLLTHKEHTYIHKMMGKIWLIAYSRWLISDEYINSLIDDWWKTIWIINKNFLNQRGCPEFNCYKWKIWDMFYKSDITINALGDIANTLKEKHWIDVKEFIEEIETHRK